MTARTSSQPFSKYFYWVDAPRVEEAIAVIKESQGIPSIPRARLRPCESLNPTFPLMHVPPEAWSASCYRQASWFRTSMFHDKHIFVSNTALGIHPCIMSGLITKVSSPGTPSTSRDRYTPLLATPEFTRRAPAEWFHLLDREVPVFKAFLDRIGLKIGLDEFLEKHSANHAHFLQPAEKVLLTIEARGERVPCSLFPPACICSACLELFGVLGSHLRAKALKNCPGLKYVQLAADEFFLVSIDDGPRGLKSEAERVQRDD